MDKRSCFLISSRFDKNSGPAVRLSNEQHKLCVQVSNKIFNRSYTMVSNLCPCGRLGNDFILSEIDRYGLPLYTVLCSSCGTLRTNPYLDNKSLADFYANFYQQMYARSEDRYVYFAKQREYGQRVLKSFQSWLPRGSFIFEVGCGAGGALDVIHDANYEVTGCDYSQELVNYGCSRGLKLHWGAPVEVLKTLPKPSLIFMHHVFEHVSDPLDLLIRLRENLSPGGKILIIVPDVRRIRDFPFPAGDLRLFIHIAHCYNFSYEGFRLLARRAGFSVDSLEKCDAYSSPEFWAILSINDGHEMSLCPHNAGLQMLEYIKRTEQLRNLYLTRGQLISLIKRIHVKLTKVWQKFLIVFGPINLNGS